MGLISTIGGFFVSIGGKIVGALNKAGNLFAIYFANKLGKNTARAEQLEEGYEYQRKQREVDAKPEYHRRSLLDRAFKRLRK